MKLYYDRDFDEYPVPDGEDMYGIGASAYDCTGLIPSAPQSEDELEAYDEIYPYLPEDE